MSVALNLKKELWANQTWEFMHSFAAAANTKLKRENFKILWKAIVDGGVPCEEMCTPHWRSICSQYNIEDYMSDNTSLLYMTFLQHNDVNKDLGKPLASWETIREKYLGQDARCDDCRSPEMKRVGNRFMRYRR